MVDCRTKMVTGVLPRPEGFRTLVNQMVSPATIAVPLKLAEMLLVVSPRAAGPSTSTPAKIVVHCRDTVLVNKDQTNFHKQRVMTRHSLFRFFSTATRFTRLSPYKNAANSSLRRTCCSEPASMLPATDPDRPPLRAPRLNENNQNQYHSRIASTPFGTWQVSVSIGLNVPYAPLVFLRCPTKNDHSSSLERAEIGGDG